MRCSVKLQRFFVLGLSGLIIGLNFWLLFLAFNYLKHLLTVLTIALILAFLLKYPVQFFERNRLSRVQAVSLVLLLTLTIVIILSVTLVSVVTDQMFHLFNQIPGWLESSQANLHRFDASARQHRLPLNLSGFSNQINTHLDNQPQALAEPALGFALGTLTGLLNLVLVIVLAFYMLLYGQPLWKALINIFPPHIGPHLNASLQLNFHNFFISQLLLGLFMFTTLTPIFLILKVSFALLFALLIGFGELIPFIGATLGIGLVTILVLFQSWRLALMVAIAAVIVQQIKDNVVAPRLMSDFTGLNPILIFIVSLIGAETAGLLRVVVAVPIAGTIKSTIEAVRLKQHAVPTITIPYDA